MKQHWNSTFPHHRSSAIKRNRYIKQHEWRRRLTPLMVGCLIAAHAGSVQADLVIPASSSYALGGGTLDLGCTDLLVSGALSVDSGAITGIRNVSIAPGGSVNVTSGSVSLSGSWANTGAFTGGTGTVRFVDLAGCAPSGGTLSGNTTFANLQFTTATGQTYQFTSGTTQTITQSLLVQGTPSAPLLWQGTVAGQPAFVSLQGTQQTTTHFGATNMTATGNPIAPGATNALPGGIAVGMFADLNVAVPTLSSIALGVLSALLGLIAFGRANRTNRTRATSRPFQA